MRKLPLLLVLLLLSLCLLAAAASAHALNLPSTGVSQVTAFAGPALDDEAESDDEEGEEAAEDEGEEDETCAREDAEAEERCEEELEAEEEAEECLLEDADASIVTAPGSEQVRLTVRYAVFELTSVVVDARLRGAKGGLHLGTGHARFKRTGVYRTSFHLGARQMAKALAAREFEVDLHAAGTPAECGLDLATRAHRRAR